MNAQVHDVARLATQPAQVRAHAEHISLESESDVAVPAERPQRHKIRSTYQLHSRLRGCTNEVSLLEDHFVSVNCGRPDRAPKSYVFDLRFANPKPILVRRISWSWLTMCLLLTVGAAMAIWIGASRGPFSLLSPAVLAGIIALLTGFGALLMFLRCTTESLEFTSMHGNATVLSVTGGIGSARAGKTFFVELIRSINAAKNARKQPKPQWLRDEMREHHRLREAGVLSEEDYEASKTRILAAHS